jgi:methyl-accepting chemotaxis protein
LSDRVKANSEKAGELMEKVNTILDEINRASQEQLKGANQVTRAVGQINTVVQQTASSSEEGAAAGEELMSQAELLGQIVGKLNVLVQGGGSKKGSAYQQDKPAIASQNIKQLSGDRRPGNLGNANVEIIKPEDTLSKEEFKDF